MARKTIANVLGVGVDLILPKYWSQRQLREKPNSAHPVSALVTAHAHLDYAVAAAYGWEWPLTEDEVLARLLARNLERAAVES